MAYTLEQLERRNQQLAALVECRSVMSKYMLFQPAYRNLDYVALWAERDDDSLDMPWGGYYGIEGVRRCYLEDHGDRSQEGFEEWSRGDLCVRDIGSEVMIPSADGQTLRAVWMTTGLETGRPHMPDRHTGYCWAHYGMDFIKVDGQWKIWHQALYPGTINHSHISWADMPRWNGYVYMQEMDFGMHHWQYSRETVYPVDRPALPEPYASFEDVAPGYAYTEKDGGDGA